MLRYTFLQIQSNWSLELGQAVLAGWYPRPFACSPSVHMHQIRKSTQNLKVLLLLAKESGMHPCTRRRKGKGTNWRVHFWARLGAIFQYSLENVIIWIAREFFLKKNVRKRRDSTASKF